MKRSLSLLVVLTLTTSAARAEKLSRGQVIALAVKANTEVQRSREDLALLQGRGEEARADALPELTLRVTGNHYKDPSILNNPTFSSFPTEFRQFFTPIEANLFEALLEVRQTLFSFKLGGALRAARYGLDLGREGVRRAEQSVALEAVRAYNRYLLSVEAARVTENSVRQKERQLEAARNRRAAGVATDLEVLRSEVDLENQRAQLVRVRGQAELERGNVNAVMLRPIDAAFEPTDTLTYVPLEWKVEDVVHEALQNRPDMKTARLNEKIYHELIGVAQSDSRPRLDLDGAWGYSVRSPSKFFARNYEKWNLGLTVSIPIFDGMRTAGRVAQARADLGKVVQDRIALEHHIWLEAKDAVDRLEVARHVLEAAELNVTQAQKALEMTQANYKHGAATTLDVVDAQAAATLADSLRIQALFDHANARAQLRYVMGYGVLDEPAPPGGGDVQ